MNARFVLRLLIVGTGVATIGAAREWGHQMGGGNRSLQATNSFLPAPRERIGVLDTATFDSLTTSISDRDPFRLTREPATIAYSSEPDAPPPPPPPRPPIMLSGIVGPPWAALLEGVPGHDGTMLAKVGDTVSRAPAALLIIRGIVRDTAVVQGLDTVWHLAVRRVWR